MTQKNSNGIIRSLAVISEQFRSAHIMEDDVLELVSTFPFVHLFDDVEDPRQKGKVTYCLPDLLAAVFYAILSFQTQSFPEIADYIEIKKDVLEKYGIIHDGKCPSHDTIRRVLTMLDADSLYENTLLGIYNFLRSLENNLLKQGDIRHIGIDGKAMRGSGRSKDSKNPQRNVAMLNVYDCGLMTAIYSEPISEKENEIPVAQRILETMNKKNAVFTCDALHCQKKTAEIIHKAKGMYVLTAKDNQELLVEEIEARFNNPRSKITVYEDKEDKRCIEILDLPKNYALKDEWAGLKTYTRMTSWKRKNKCIRFFISNTSDHELIQQAIRERWEIENDYHKLKDEMFKEDTCRITNKNALHNIALLNNLALVMFNLHHHLFGTILRRSKMEFYVKPIECINRILMVMSSQELVDELVTGLKKSKKKR